MHRTYPSGDPHVSKPLECARALCLGPTLCRSSLAASLQGERGREGTNSAWFRHFFVLLRVARTHGLVQVQQRSCRTAVFLAPPVLVHGAGEVGLREKRALCKSVGSHSECHQDRHMWMLSCLPNC